MNTAIKVHVAAGQGRSLEKTEGVHEPSDPKHYPPLGSRDPGHALPNANRLSRSSMSFKEKLAIDGGVPAVEVTSGGTSPTAAASTSRSTQKVADEAQGAWPSRAPTRGPVEVLHQESRRSDASKKEYTTSPVSLPAAVRTTSASRTCLPRHVDARWRQSPFPHASGVAGKG